MSETATSENYQVLARKYRPMTFEDMIGQDALVKTLTNAFATGRVAHAFMLTGVRGIGKTTTARLLARALNYESEDHDGPSVNLTPPGRHCAAINASSHMDVLEMDAASRTGVGDIREILDSVRYGPVEARYKIYIIDEVHMLSTQAFNALLKTLEEPPAHAKFIFATTEIRKIPITVLSRCQRFDLKRVDADALTRHLAGICEKEGADIAPDGLRLIARAAEGSVRDALSLLDQAIVQADKGKTVTPEDIRAMLGLADRTRVLDVLGHAMRADAKAVLDAVRAQYVDGADPVVLMRDLLDLCHEVSRAKVLGAAAEFDMAPDQIARLTDLAESLSMGQITRAWQILLRAHEDVRMAPDPLAAAEMALLRLAVAADLPPPELAAQLLESLKNIPDAAPTPAGPGKGSGSVMTTGSAVAATAPVTEDHTNPLANPLANPVAKQEAKPAAKPDIQTLDELIAALSKTRRGLAYEVEKYLRLIRMEAGTLIFSLAPKAPRDFEYKLRAWLTETTARPWHVEVKTDIQGAPSRREAQKQAERERKAAEEAHPAARLARKLFPDAEIEFRDVAPISNVVSADFNTNEDKT